MASSRADGVLGDDPLVATARVAPALVVDGREQARGRWQEDEVPREDPVVVSEPVDVEFIEDEQ